MGPTPLRRLTRSEYDATVKDLLPGIKGSPADGLPPDSAADGFDNDVGNQGASPLLAGAYLRAAERISGGVDLTMLLPCAVAEGGEECGRQFIERLGKRAFRRPLRPTEAAQLGGFFRASLAAHGFEQAARLTLQLILASPQFLYRLELAPAATGQTARLSPYEVAARLSYFLWGTMPDEALFAAADAGQLASREQVAQQAARLVDSPRARVRLRGFFRQWLVLDDLGDVTRDSKRYPGWSASLTKEMEAEALTFADKLVFDEKGSVEALLSAPASYMNKALATYLGVKGPAASAFDRVALDPARAAGLVTLSGPLAMNAKEDQPHPIYRGRWVRQQLLCQVPPPPPPGLVAQTPKLEDKATTRQVFTQHATDPACSGCHRLLDPIGFGLERYDATGKWRDTDRGLPIDVRGELVDAGDASGAFEGAAELGRKLGKSEAALGCVATQLFRYGSGRHETGDDACALASMRALANQASGNLRALILSLTQTDAFLLRAGQGGT
jgi:hypothetical protein